MVMLCAILLSANSFGQLRISQVYGGGGNSGAPYTRDFVELFNAGSSPIVASNYSIQYASATGSSWTVQSFSATIPAGGYFLIALAVGAGAGVALPTPDISGSIAMSGTAGKVALSNSNVALTGTCPTVTVIDFVGFGSTANCFEGAGPTPAPSNSLSVSRGSGGCLDAGNNN
ncbi:MAG: lamin tail domain-containing protein, partial [Bacteroidia bacterium]|nr:lamin tail domain-containing protein [Bacteroidia bacterium]